MGLARFGKEAGLNGIGGQQAQFITAETVLGVGEEELAGEIGTEECGIVGVERNEKGAVEVMAQGVGGEGGADAGANVGGRVQFQGNAAGLEMLEESFVPNGGECVADALGADGESLPEGFRAGGFAGMVGEAEACVAGASVESTEGLGAGAALVATETDADDGGILATHFGGFAEDALRLLDSKVADGVEDPVNRETQLEGSALAGAFESLKDRFEAARIEVAPHINDADRDINFGMNYALSGKLLHHAPGREFVIFRLLQPTGNSLEGFNEAGEVREAVEGFGFAEGHGALVAACTELNQVWRAGWCLRGEGATRPWGERG